MMDFDKSCCVCLHVKADLRVISENSSDSDSFRDKLIFIVPEIEWKSHFSICCGCKTDLENSYLFKRQCLKSDSMRGKFIFVEENEETELKPENRKPQERRKTKLNCEEKTLQDLRKYQCHVCKKKCSQSSNLCDQCKKTFNRRNQKENSHLQKHSTFRPIVCELCPHKKRFLGEFQLKRHIRRIHSGNNEFPCAVCGKVYTSRFRLNVHRKKIHDLGNYDLKKFCCPYCSKKKVFLDKWKFERHVKIHTNEDGTN